MTISRTLILIVLAISPLAAQDWRIEVNHVIERGVVDLLRYQKDDGSFDTPVYTNYNTGDAMGVTALATYTLLKSGLPKRDPALGRAFDWLHYQGFQRVYGVSILVFALDASKDPKHRPQLLKAAAWLEEKLRTSVMRWGYPESVPDYSNTQFAVLALRVAQKHGYKVEQATWRGIAKSLLDFQSDDGGFGYRPNLHIESSGSMTSAGITCLFVAKEGLEGTAGLAAFCRQIDGSMVRAWKWLDDRFTAGGNPAFVDGRLRDIYPNTTWHYYYLYGIERIATFAKRRLIGGRDWYREGAIHLLGTERAMGGWRSLADTCFALLFLRRATFTGENDLVKEAPPGEFWRFTEKTPPASWSGIEFNDNKWIRGTGPFATSASTLQPKRSIWKTKKTIWARRGFKTHKPKDPDIRLFALCDEEIDVFVNGVRAGGLTTWSHSYREIPLSDEARAAIVGGRNVLSFAGRNEGGEGVMDVRLTRNQTQVTRIEEWNTKADVFTWWKKSPQKSLPFFRRWLVLGPIADSEGLQFLKSLLPDEEADPKAGDRHKNFTWRETTSPTARVVFGTKKRARGAAVSYAATQIEVSRKGSFLLWLGGQGALAAWLDGKPLLRHPKLMNSKLDRFVIPCLLDKGRHRLLIKVRHGVGEPELFCRMSDAEGELSPDLRPITGKDPRANVAWCDDATLLKTLPKEPLGRLGFSRPVDLNRIAMMGAAPRFPKMIKRFGKKATFRGPPGANGILATRVASATEPLRILRRHHLARDKHALSVKVAARCGIPSAKTSIVLRLGVYDGKMTWYGEEKLSASERPTAKDWRLLSANLEGFAGRDVLVVIEARRDGIDSEGAVFIDEISLR